MASPSQNKPTSRLEQLSWIAAIVSVVLPLFIAQPPAASADNGGTAVVADGGAAAVAGDNNISSATTVSGNNSTNIFNFPGSGSIPAAQSQSPAVSPLDFENDDDRLSYAADLIGRGELQPALDFLNAFLSMDGLNYQSDVSAHYDRGLCHLYLGNYNQAISDFECVTQASSYPDAHYNLGRALEKLDHYEEALKAYNTALSIEDKEAYHKAKDALLERIGQDSEPC